jgi:integrase
LRGRIESILDWAVAAKVRPEGPNPARWSGHLEFLLASPARRKTVHHAAMPIDATPRFVAQLRELDGPAARAFEFLVQTAARSGEVRGATWDEIDRHAKLWTIPASRMKAGKEHRVPLSARCIEILDEMAALRTGDFVFPGQRGKLGASVFQEILIRLGHDATVHGFRSAFRDWCGDHTVFPREVAEAALAHTVGNKAELSYRRSDALQKRRKLMEAWTQFLAAPMPEGEVVPLRRAVPA